MLTRINYHEHVETVLKNVLKKTGKKEERKKKEINNERMDGQIREKVKQTGRKKIKQKVGLIDMSVLLAGMHVNSTFFF